MGCIKKKHSHQPKILSRNSFRALAAHQIKHICSHLFLQGALCCGTMPSNYLAETRAFIYLNTFTTHPHPDPIPKNGDAQHLCESSSCTSDSLRSLLHSWGHLRAREGALQVKASLPAQRAEGKPRGAQKTGDVCHHCQPCRRFAAGFAAALLEETGCPRRGPADGDASPTLGKCLCEPAGQVGSEEPRKAALCQTYRQTYRRPALGGTQSKPSQVARDSRPRAHRWLRADCRSSSSASGFQRPWSRNWNQRETVRGKSAFLWHGEHANG